MQRLLKHRARIRQQAHRKRLRNAGFSIRSLAHAQAMTGIVRNLSPTHVLMVAGFLRQQIRRAIAEGVRIPNASFACLRSAYVSSGPTP